LTDSDFQHLKNEQSLLIDFHSFIKKYFELINIAQTLNGNGKSSFKVVLKQNTNAEAELQILECNQFRQICHIYLKMRKADDDKLKK